MSGSGHRVICAIGGSHDQIHILYVVREIAERILHGFKRHGVYILTLATFRTGLYACALHDPFGCQTVDFEEMIVAYAAFGDIISC